MPDTELPITGDGTPSGLCWTNPSDDIPNIIAPNLRAIFSGNEVNVGSSTPSAADRSKPWIRTNSDGSDDGVWSYYAGYWVQKHPDFVGKIVFAPVGTAAADIDALDGGETAAITAITGPFWEIVTELSAKSIIGPGTLASGTVIAPGDSIGEEKHLLTVDEMPEHTHEFATEDSQHVLVQCASSAKLSDINRTGSLDYKHADPLQSTGGGESHNVIHPCYALYAIRRTARLYRRRVA